jgi:hypothetical protein
MHDINDSAHKDTMCVLPHLNAVEGIINLVHREFLKVVVGAVATDIIDRVDIKKSALNIWIVKIVKETVA